MASYYASMVHDPSVSKWYSRDVAYVKIDFYPSQNWHDGQETFKHLCISNKQVGQNSKSSLWSQLSTLRLPQSHYCAMYWCRWYWTWAITYRTLHFHTTRHLLFLTVLLTMYGVHRYQIELFIVYISKYMFSMYRHNFILILTYHIGCLHKRSLYLSVPFTVSLHTSDDTNSTSVPMNWHKRKRQSRNIEKYHLMTSHGSLDKYSHWVGTQTDWV